MLFVIEKQAAGIPGGIHLYMFPVYCPNAVWEVPARLKPPRHLSPTFFCGRWHLGLHHSFDNGLTGLIDAVGHCEPPQAVVKGHTGKFMAGCQEPETELDINQFSVLDMFLTPLSSSNSQDRNVRPGGSQSGIPL